MTTEQEIKNKIHDAIPLHPTCEQIRSEQIKIRVAMRILFAELLAAQGPKPYEPRTQLK